MAATPTAGASRGAVLTGFALLSVLALLPVLSVRLPPILDYPNHLARMHILASLPSTPELARFYLIRWAPLPNLALDAVVPWIGRVIGAEAAMRVSVGVTLLGLAGGTLVLHYTVFRRWSLWPLTAFLLLYNRMLLWGFLNYLAALAVTLWALAAWIAMERKPMHLRIAVGTILATTIYLGHLAAFGCYALSLLALSLRPTDGAGWSIRRILPSLVTLVPAGILFLLAPTSGGSVEISYGNIFRKLDLPISLVDNYNRVFDGITFGVLLIAVIVGLLRGALIMDKRLRWCVAAVLLAFLLIPARLLSAAGIDHRLPVAIALLFIAGTDWTAFRHRKAVAVALLGLLLVRMGVVETVWLKADRQYDALRPALESLNDGMTVAVASPARSVQAGGVPLLHYPTLAVLRRNAFVPTLFADPLQQPVVLTETASALAKADQPAALWTTLAEGRPLSLTGYDALMIVDPPSSLDRSSLPGEILFNAPRLMVVRLPGGR
jgi:hypothetical protein